MVGRLFIGNIGQGIHGLFILLFSSIIGSILRIRVKLYRGTNFGKRTTVRLALSSTSLDRCDTKPDQFTISELKSISLSPRNKIEKRNRFAFQVLTWMITFSRLLISASSLFYFSFKQ